MSSWLLFALLSAIAAALVSIFGKFGLDGIDANVATTIRSIIMALFMIGVIIIQGKFQNIGDVLLNKKSTAIYHIKWDCRCFFMAILFSCPQNRKGFTSSSCR